jgi:hypothetical protein
MTNSPATFSFPSRRALFKFLGETDALVELTELATRFFTAAAISSKDVGAFVEAQSREHRVRVNLAEMDLLSRHLSRSYIVTVYQSAEQFLREFRKEHIALYQKSWIGDAEKIDPLTLTLQNVSNAQAAAEGIVGLDLISRFQYYRIVRNWVVHGRESDISRPEEKFKDIVPYSPEHEKALATLEAPNPPTSLSFDDFIYFSRLTKLIAEKLCEIATPTTDHLVHQFSLKRFKRLEKNPTRMRNAVIGRLRTEYGMDSATAGWIADELL